MFRGLSSPRRTYASHLHLQCWPFSHHTRSVIKNVVGDGVLPQTGVRSTPNCGQHVVSAPQPLRFPMSIMIARWLPMMLTTPPSLFSFLAHPIHDPAMIISSPGSLKAVYMQSRTHDHRLAAVLCLNVTHTIGDLLAQAKSVPNMRCHPLQFGNRASRPSPAGCGYGACLVGYRSCSSSDRVLIRSRTCQV